MTGKGDSYNWNAADYAKHSSAQLGWARELIKKLHLQGDETVLDIGCGDGKVTAEIASQIPEGRIIGIDNSAEMIDLASTTFPVATHPNLTFKTADARKLTFDGEFDVVFSNAVLHWITDHRPVISGVSASLAHGGRGLLQMGGRGNAQSIIGVLSQLIGEDRWRAYFTDFVFPYGFFSPDDYAPWLEMAGLEAVRVELIPKDMTYENADGLAGWLRTTWLPYTSRVPEEQRDEFIATLVEKYTRAFPPDDDGILHVGMVRLEAELLKKS